MTASVLVGGALFVLLMVTLVTFAYAGLRAAPWVPTRTGDVERFVRMARLRPGERFYDIGCGDGRLVSAAAHAGADAVGFECSLLPYALSWLRPGARGRVRYRDFWHQPLHDADVIYCWLMPGVYPKLKAKFERECRPGTRIVLYVWPMEGWAPHEVDIAEGSPKLYAYTL
ncbi:MAG: hypothetical protein Q7T01_04005 [bacterium]|nr:hypothetical protein [bacterium]